MRPAAFLLIFIACDGSVDTPRNEPASPPAAAPAPMLEGPSERETECDEGSRKDTYAAGLAKMSGDVEVSIVEATPAPPAKGVNVMTFALRDAAGPITDATLRMKPYMPDHNHGSAWTPEVTPLADGQYRIDKIQLAMPGRWSLMIEITRPGRQAENVAYDFCVEDPPSP